MRSTTAGEQTILGAAARNNYVTVEVRDAAGTYRDLGYGEYYGYNLVEGLAIDTNVDQPASECRVLIRRDVGSSALSFAPLITGSSSYTTGPAIDTGREIRVQIATTAAGVAPVAGDWQNMFEGEIDVVDWTSSPIEIIARDKAGELIDRFVEAETEYGSSAGTAIETVIQDILDDWADGPPTLYTPTSPSFLIAPASKWKHVSVMEALQGHVRLIGWDVRYKWDDGIAAWRLTLYEPDRAKTVPDWTFAPNRILAVNQMRIDRDPIRNVVAVEYTDSSTGNRATQTYTNSTSVTRFGRRWMLIQEGGDSPINTSTEALDMATAAGSDLSVPTAEQTVEMHYFWPVELGDLLRFSDNDIHYDSNQDMAVTTIRHEFGWQRERTILGVRGKPQGFYLNWHRLSPQGSPDKIRIPHSAFWEAAASGNVTRDTTGLYMSGSGITATLYAPLPTTEDIEVLTGLRVRGRLGTPPGDVVSVELIKQGDAAQTSIGTASLTTTGGTSSTSSTAAFSEIARGNSYILKLTLTLGASLDQCYFDYCEVDVTRRKS